MECSLVGEYRLIFVGSITCCFFLALDVHTVWRLLADIFRNIRQTTDDAAKITGYFETLNSVGIVHGYCTCTWYLLRVLAAYNNTFQF